MWMTKLQGECIHRYQDENEMGDIQILVHPLKTLVAQHTEEATPYLPYSRAFQQCIYSLQSALQPRGRPFVSALQQWRAGAKRFPL